MTAVLKKKRGRPKDELGRARRREQILDAAAPIFAKHGYQDADVQVVADVLGVGKGTIYRYFPSKEELFLAAVDRGMHRLHEAVHGVIDDLEDPLSRMEQGIYLYLAFFRDHPEYVELLMQERAVFKDRKKPTYFVHRDANIGAWHDLYRGLIAAGRVRQVPVERILDVVSDLVYGTMFTNYFSARHKPLEAQARDIIDIFFHGILTDAERKRRLAR